MKYQQLQARANAILEKYQFAVNYDEPTARKLFQEYIQELNQVQTKEDCIEEINKRLSGDSWIPLDCRMIIYPDDLEKLYHLFMEARAFMNNME